jgi:hypothetical protein
MVIEIPIAASATERKTRFDPSRLEDSSVASSAVGET